MAQHELKKELGLFETTVYGIGIILGAGIYAIIGSAAGVTGDAVWLSFVLAAIMAAFTGLSYAELSSMYPKAAAAYVYTKKAFNRKDLSFLIAWIVIIGLVVAGATVAIAFAGYFSAIFATPIIPVAMAAIILFTIINFIGIKESAKFNIISTFIEAGGLILIIILGFSFWGSPDVNYFAMQNGIPGLLAGVTLVFFAFIGFENVANISEETKNAHKVIPKALLISLFFSTILYILVAVSAVSVLGSSALAASNAPLTDVAVAVVGPGILWIYSIIALFATGNTLLIFMIVASRMLYGISREGGIPKIFGHVHHKKKTPFYSILVIGIASMLFILAEDIAFVATLTDIGVFIAYFFVNLALIWLRYKKPDEERHFKMPGNIGRFPVLAALGALSCFLILFQFEITVILAEIVVIIVGAIIYWAYSWYKRV
ncbi:MAG: APC family permease [Candidatus Aenigmatarchaeota archaeon]|nr:APC family permease [Nanoarchaeota archaeon]